MRVETISAEEQHQDITIKPVQCGHQTVRMPSSICYAVMIKRLLFSAAHARQCLILPQLANRGLSVVALSGELNQAARNQAIQAMRDGRARVCGN